MMQTTAQMQISLGMSRSWMHMRRQEASCKLDDEGYRGRRGFTGYRAHLALASFKTARGD